MLTKIRINNRSYDNMSAKEMRRYLELLYPYNWKVIAVKPVRDQLYDFVAAVQIPKRTNKA